MAGVYSTANDLLKFLSASVPASSRLRPLWERTVANFAFSPPRPGLLNAGGGWFANGCYLGFDKARRRGVVVPANGRYEVAPGAAFPKGLKMTVWREGAQLLGRAQHPGGDRVLLGAFPIFPESETNFFEKLTGAQFRFTKNDQGQVTALTHHYTGATLAWFPDWEAKKVSVGTIQKEGR